MTNKYAVSFVKTVRDILPVDIRTFYCYDDVDMKKLSRTKRDEYIAKLALKLSLSPKEIQAVLLVGGTKITTKQIGRIIKKTDKSIYE